jgi:hypothetical protein
MRNLISFTLLFSLLLVAGNATAEDNFESRAKRTTHITQLEKVLGPFLQKCGTTNELPDLHCRAIRAYMQRKISQKLYSSYSLGTGLKFGKYNAKFEYPVTVRGCITCGAPALFDPLLFKSNKFFVTTRKPTKMVDNKPSGLDMGKFTIPVDPRELGKWTKTVKPFLRVQFLYKVMGSGVWDKKMGNGITLYMGGYRVYDHCTGKVYYSEPASKGLAPIDTKGCVKKVAKVNTGPVLPKMPKSSKIRDLMRSIRPQIIGCYKQYQIPGKAKVKLYISGKDGKVFKVRVRGDFKGTPTGTCVVKVIKTLDFGKFTKKKISFKYNYSLQ